MTATHICDTNKELIRTLFGGIWHGDLAPLEAHPGYWQTRQVFPMLLAAFHKVEDVVFQQIAEGDSVFSYSAARLIHHGPLLGLPPAGRQVVQANYSLDDVRDRVVVQHNGASTGPDMLRQLGAPFLAAWPAAPAPMPLPAGIPDAMAPSARKGIVADLLAALCAGASAGQHPGAGALRDEFAAIRTAFPDVRLTVVRQIIEGDLVGTRATLTGTHTGPLHGIPPTGRVVTWDLFTLDQVANGLVAAHRGTADWLDLLGKIGVIPPPPGAS
jgi:predicted ester cyclase